MPAKVISMNNRKGGTSKTCSSVNLAYEFSKAGYKTLLIDQDPQGNASSKFIEEYEEIPGIAEVYAGEANIKAVIHQTSANSNLFIITSKIELDDVAEYMQGNARIALLRKHLNEIRGDFDCIIVDNNPGIPILLKNCVYATDLIVIPVNIDRNSMKGVDLTLKKIRETIYDAPTELNLDYRIMVSMVTYSKGEMTNIAKGAVQAIKDIYGRRVLDTTIRLQSKPAQLQTFENDYYATDHNTGYADDYRKLRTEIEKLVNMDSVHIERRTNETDQSDQ